MTLERSHARVHHVISRLMSGQQYRDLMRDEGVCSDHGVLDRVTSRKLGIDVLLRRRYERARALPVE